MCSCLPAGACPGVCTCEFRGLEETSGVILKKIMRLGLSLTYSSLIRLEWMARIPQGSSWSFLLSAGITHVHHHARHFYMNSGIQHGSSCSQGKGFDN